MECCDQCHVFEYMKSNAKSDIGKHEFAKGIKAMSKMGKIVLIILSFVLGLMVVTWLFVGALWSGAFNFLFPKEVATYNSPDGEYSLVFEQMGDPAWPFGPADVRLTLKNSDGKVIKRVSTQVFNDGGSASEWNMKSVSWENDAVVVILQGAEMEDKEVIIAYNKS